MNRLDDVLGPENWWDDFVPLEHSVICRLTIRLPDGTTLTKGTRAATPAWPTPGDDDKSGFADAFKRAAVKFGVGRYLYRDGIPRFAREALGGRADGQPPARTPTGPAPGADAAARRPAPGAPVRATDDEGLISPRTGRALFAWTKDQDEKYEYGLLKHLNAWGQGQDFPGRMVHWEGEQVHAGLRRGLPQDPRDPGHAARHRGGAVELTHRRWAVRGARTRREQPGDHGEERGTAPGPAPAGVVPAPRPESERQTGLRIAIDPTVRCELDALARPSEVRASQDRPRPRTVDRDRRRPAVLSTYRGDRRRREADARWTSSSWPPRRSHSPRPGGLADVAGALPGPGEAGAPAGACSCPAIGGPGRPGLELRRHRPDPPDPGRGPGGRGPRPARPAARLGGARST